METLCFGGGSLVSVARDTGECCPEPGGRPCWVGCWGLIDTCE